MSFGKLLLTFIVLVNSSAKITGLVFYEHSNHQGGTFTAPANWAENGKCNFMDGFNDKASSIDTKGQCVIVYEHGGCNGEERLIQPGSCCHNHLADIQMNDRISSYKACQSDTCPEDSE